MDDPVFCLIDREKGNIGFKINGQTSVSLII